MYSYTVQYQSHSTSASNRVQSHPGNSLGTNWPQPQPSGKVYIQLTKKVHHFYSAAPWLCKSISRNVCGPVCLSVCLCLFVCPPSLGPSWWYAGGSATVPATSPSRSKLRATLICWHLVQQVSRAGLWENLCCCWMGSVWTLWDESLMVSAATQVSLLRKHGSHSSAQLFSLSLVEASGGFRATF